MSHFVSRAGILVHTKHLLQHHECPVCGAKRKEVQVKVLYISGAGAGTGDAARAIETQCGSFTPKKKEEGSFRKASFRKTRFSK